MPSRSSRSAALLYAEDPGGHGRRRGDDALVGHPGLQATFGLHQSALPTRRGVRCGGGTLGDCPGRAVIRLKGHRPERPLYGTVLSRPNRYLDAMDRYIRDAIERAQDAVMGSHLARTEALRLRHAWGTWPAQWAEIEAMALADRMLTVCIYCERFRVTTGEHDQGNPRPDEGEPHPRGLPYLSRRQTGRAGWITREVRVPSAGSGA